MATAKRTPELPAAADAPDVVTLRSENLGKTKDFTPAHAKALLALQESKGIKNGWAAAEPETPADNA